MSGDPAADLHGRLDAIARVLYASSLEVVPVLGEDAARRLFWAAFEVDAVVDDLARGIGQGSL